MNTRTGRRLFKLQVQFAVEPYSKMHFVCSTLNQAMDRLLIFANNEAAKRAPVPIEGLHIIDGGEVEELKVFGEER